MAGRRLVVIGAGISGLAAALSARDEAASRRRALEVVVLERGREVGGRVRSRRHDGWLVESGASGFLDDDATVAWLTQAAGLEPRRVYGGAGRARRYIYSGGRPHELAPSPRRLASPALLGVTGLLRLAGELVVGAAPAGTEESVFGFCARRFGPRAAELARTGVLGITAGDATRLSLDACFPELRRLERRHGSVLRGLSKAARERPHGARARTLTTFRDGLQELPRAIAAMAGIDVRTGVEAVAVERQGTAGGPAGLRVLTRGGDALAAAAVVVAVPAAAAAPLLDRLAPVAATELRAIAAPPMAVVALGYSHGDAAALPSGYGMLVRRGEGIRMLGSLWESQIYPDRAPSGHVLLRVMFGGATDADAAALEDASLVDLATDELRRTLGLTGRPCMARVQRWERAIPQYEIGHASRRDRILEAVAAVPGLHLAGDALEGFSFVKSAATGIRRGRAAAADTDGREGR